MSLYTKTGDGGQTDLANGLRVSKADHRVECCGTVDELNCALGLAKSLSQRSYVWETLRDIQQTLSALCAELSGSGGGRIGQPHVAQLEKIIDHCTEKTGPFSGFVTPGANPPSAALHLARSIARRLEREMVRAGETGHPCDPALLSYVNRLSDALFALARLEE